MMIQLYCVENSDPEFYQHTVLVPYDELPKDYKTWRQDDFFDTFLVPQIEDGNKDIEITYVRKIDKQEYCDLARINVRKRDPSIVVD